MRVAPAPPDPHRAQHARRDDRASHIIWGSRINSTATGLDANGDPVGSASLVCEAAPTTAYDGTNYLVAWQDWRVASDPVGVYATRVSATGTVLDASGIAVAAPALTTAYSNPVAIFGGGQYVIAFVKTDTTTSNSGVIAANSVSTAGVAGTVTAITSDAPASHPTLVYGSGALMSAGGYLFAWQLTTSGKNSAVEGTLFDTPFSGGVTAINFTLPTSTSNQAEPCVGYNATKGFLLTWADSTSGHYQIHDEGIDQTTGALSGTDTHIYTTSYDQHNPVLAFDGTHYLAAWQETSATSQGIQGAFLSNVGAWTSNVTISTGTGDRITPSITYDSADHNYFFGWIDYRAGSTSPNVWVREVSTSGTPGTEAQVNTDNTSAHVSVSVGATKHFIIAHQRYIGTGTTLTTQVRYQIWGS